MLRLKMFFCSFFELSFHLHVCMATTCKSMGKSANAKLQEGMEKRIVKRKV